MADSSIIYQDHTKVREIKLISLLVILTSRNPHTPTHTAIHAYPLSHYFSPNRRLGFIGNQPETRNLHQIKQNLWNARMNISQSGSATHVLAQSSLGHLPKNLNSSPSNRDIVDLIKEVKEDVKRIRNESANYVEKMSFVMSAMKSVIQRLDNLSSSASTRDIVDVMKEVKEIKEDVKRIGNEYANCVEKMSFVMSAMESMSRRLDRIDTRLGIQDTHPQIK